MKITSIDVSSCEGGWRTLNFIKIQTDEGITGYAECNCVRSEEILRAAIGYLGSLVIGRNLFQTEKIQFDLYRATQRQLGGAAHQAISGISKLAKALEPFNMLWLEAETLDPRALKSVRESTSTPICIGESLYRTQGFKPFLKEHALDIIMPDTVWNGITMGKKVADYANTYDILFAPHNSHGVLGGLQVAHLCATCENFKILEYEHGDVPWRDEIATDPIAIKDGCIELTDRPGFGCDIVEEQIAEHPPATGKRAVSRAMGQTR